MRSKSVESYLKNSGLEYRELIKKQHASGAETEPRDSLQLRGSHEVFIAFEQYYETYHQKGGAVMPMSVHTEAGETML
jgi:hypothetical protein